MKNKASSTNEIYRITLGITLCMILGKLLGLHSPVYLALYPIIVMTKCKDYSWRGLFNILFPSFLAAYGALVLIEVFHEHPMIIWSISLLFFDRMRCYANTPIKLNRIVMPLFNWLLIIIFSQQDRMDMSLPIREIVISMVITAIIAKILILIFPSTESTKSPKFKEKIVTYQHRVVSTGLIGIGLAFLMIVDLVSATFCMVPVIAAATQFNKEAFKDMVYRRFITQIGGCAIALIFTVLMSGHQHIIILYALALGLLVFILATWMVNSQGAYRVLHADAILATMLPIQLYLGSTTFGFENTYLRAWELACTFAILYILHQLRTSRE